MRHFLEKASVDLSKLCLNEIDCKERKEILKYSSGEMGSLKKFNLHESFIMLCEINPNMNQENFKALERFKLRI